MAEATFFLSTRLASPGPGTFEGHTSPGNTYYVPPGHAERGVRDDPTCPISHSLSKQSISTKPMLRACADRETHQPVLPTPQRTLYAAASDTGQGLL